MYKILLMFLLMSCINSYAQTAKFIGTYLRDKDKDTTGELILYPETDSSILFYIEDWEKIGYNSGSLTGRMIIKGKDSALYYHPSKDFNCVLSFKLKHNSISVKTVDGHDDCGNGNGVENDGTYYLSDKAKQEHFINRHNDKMFFNNLINLPLDSIPQ